MDISNLFILVFIVFLVVSVITRVTLDLLNFAQRKRKLGFIPDILKEHIDKEKLLQIDRYSNEKLLFSMISYFTDKIILIILLAAGFYPWIYRLLTGITINPYFLCLAFFGISAAIDTLLSIPFSLYFNFVIEKKFGFNKMQFGTWVADFLKDIVISVIFGVLLLVPVVFLLSTFTQLWWIFVWGLMLAFSLIMQIVYPTWIAPLFNKFAPLPDGELKDAIENLLHKTGYASDGVFEMDASKRSGHSNAYFTGLGKTKKIVLFDTLIKELTTGEIVGVLAHEIGHYKKKHILKGMIVSSLLSLAGFFLAYLFTRSESIYAGFGFVNITPANALYIGLFLLSIVAGPVMFFTKPLFASLSRKHEYEADQYARESTGTPEALVQALIKLNVKNLSNLYPAPLYVAFYYSHPTLLDRIERLRS